MAKARFREWVRSKTAHDNPRGDFIKDAKFDRELPDVSTFEELERYLRRKRACDDAIDAAKSLWKEFLRKKAGEAS